MNPSRLYKLKGRPQHYQWGGYTFLYDLLHFTPTTNKPFAEYWLGAHDNAPAELQGEQVLPLNTFLQSHPEMLGKKVAQRFGRLPYLLKVLDVKDMLSIQVHPSKEAALEEFEKENKRGISLQAANRNYKDDNHKPELMVALSDFWLLHGFRPKEEIVKLSQSIPEFRFMFALLEEGDYKGLYRNIMEEDQDRVNRILQPLLDRIVPAYKEGKLEKHDPNFWAARAALTYNEPEVVDRGIFSVYLLNLVHLRKGEAIFQDAGILHAYLEGQNMEIMANSDNVLRGGLTPKHVDVGELMKHVSFEQVIPQVIHGVKRAVNEEVYPSPAPDFELSKYEIRKGDQSCVTPSTTEIFITMEGKVNMAEQDGPAVFLDRGEAAVVFAGATLTVDGVEDAIVFRASVPE